MGGSLPDSEPTISMAVAKSLSWSPLFNASYHFLPVSVARISGSPLSNCGMRPYISAWSEMTRKSSGRESLARRPSVVVISSPRAKRKASSCPTRHMVPASTEIAVCRWVSPKKTRVG